MSESPIETRRCADLHRVQPHQQKVSHCKLRTLLALAPVGVAQPACHHAVWLVSPGLSMLRFVRSPRSAAVRLYTRCTYWCAPPPHVLSFRARSVRVTVASSRWLSSRRLTPRMLGSLGDPELPPLPDFSAPDMAARSEDGMSRFDGCCSLVCLLAPTCVDCWQVTMLSTAWRITTQLLISPWQWSSSCVRLGSTAIALLDWIP